MAGGDRTQHGAADHHRDGQQQHPVAAEPVHGGSLRRAGGRGVHARRDLTWKGSEVHLRAQFEQDMGGWLKSGAMKYEETVMAGIEQAPQALIGLFTGANTGKMLVKL